MCGGSLLVVEYVTCEIREHNRF